MNLIIDQGNSRVKTAVFLQGRLLYKNSCSLEAFPDELGYTLERYTEINAGLLSSVGGFPHHLLSLMEEKLDLLQLDHRTPLPFSSCYTTKETLGVDRLGLAAAAVMHYPDQAVLVIDIGTCITYDLIDAQGVHQGGAIAPGIRMRYRAMNAFTARLPLLHPVNDFSLIGQSTAACMHSGVLQALLFEVEGYLQALRKDHKGLKLVVTGGDTHFLRDNLKSDIFAHSNFLLEGLNFILDHNLGRC